MTLATATGGVPIVSRSGAWTRLPSLKSHSTTTLAVSTGGSSYRNISRTSDIENRAWNSAVPSWSVSAETGGADETELIERKTLAASRSRIVSGTTSPGAYRAAAPSTYTSSGTDD